MINKKQWEEAEKLCKLKCHTLNYPNIYVEYIAITDKANQRMGYFARWSHKKKYLKKIMQHKWYKPHLDEQLSKIEDEIAVLKSYCEPYDCDEDRYAVIDHIRSAMMKRYNECGIKSDDGADDNYFEFIEEKTSESDVWVGLLFAYKVKDIFANYRLKPHDPWWCFYEHLVTFILFPIESLKFLGYGLRNGKPALTFEQNFFAGHHAASDYEVEKYMELLGFRKHNKYSYTDDWCIITDLTGKNVLSDGRGFIRVIDPVIYFLKPPKEVIEHLIQSRKKWIWKPVVRHY